MVAEVRRIRGQVDPGTVPDAAAGAVPGTVPDVVPGAIGDDVDNPIDVDDMPGGDVNGPIDVDFEMGEDAGDSDWELGSGVDSDNGDGEADGSQDE